MAHNKIYTSLEEKNRRFRIFAANMKKVKLLQNNEQGSAIYGATQFADFTSNLSNSLKIIFVNCVSHYGSTFKMLGLYSK